MVVKRRRDTMFALFKEGQKESLQGRNYSFVMKESGVAEKYVRLVQDMYQSKMMPCRSGRWLQVGGGTDSKMAP